jgi:serine O-acetyltransferase
MFELFKEDCRTYDCELSRQGLWVMAAYRFGRWRYTIRPALLRKPFSMIYRVLKLASQILTGIDIPCEATLGRRVRIEHFGGIIVSGDAVIGDDVILRHGVTIGMKKVGEPGSPVIGNRVEIGALTTVDRAMLDATVIEDGTKIDNHCHVAHNCHIGPDCIMAGAAKMAGSVRLGRGVILAEDAGISDHVTIGDGAIVGGRSGVHSDIGPGEVVLGEPARPVAVQRRIFALTGRLPQTADRLRALEKKVDELAERLKGQSD